MSTGHKILLGVAFFLVWLFGFYAGTSYEMYDRTKELCGSIRSAGVHIEACDGH